MFCKNCGKEIDDSFKNCPHCGVDVVTSKKVESKEDESHVTQIFSTIVSLIVIGVIWGVIDFDFLGTSSTNDGKSTKLEVTESHSCNLGYGAKGICGTVKNNSGRNFGYVQVEINLYDKSGNLIDSTLSNINNLGSGSIWKFEAPIIQDNVATYEIKNITGI